ncbi:OmpA family protein [Halioglobus pacificus]|uniref:OmpA-like domain-containing protein n=1 Tax=Parahalioglobus pacificus TaxID=930806 RepID=A0A918XKW0_9GAMM|nr:OmpA family protein [Halioglobus pacificus]NQY02193.1 OmpA family protein [Halieaceae bacterium]GHD36672.1 hypothetical protein GCM10007053_25350 [Halioglobus pacificus]
MWGALLIPIVAWQIVELFTPEEIPDTVADKVILLPDADGSVGEVVVRSATGEQTLSSAYGALEVTASGTLESTTETAASVRAAYGNVLDAQPPEPVSLTVYFEAGSSTELTATSLQTIDRLKAVLADRPAPEILVIGHTDTVGDLEDNDSLSRARAQTVVDVISATGVDAASLEASGRGERELLVPTADKVSEPRNRRVEINIR